MALLAVAAVLSPRSSRSSGGPSHRSMPLADLPRADARGGQRRHGDLASIAFSGFFLLALYLQQVLGYSAAQNGVAFTAIALTVAVVSNVAHGS